MFQCRLPSFNALEAHRKETSWKKWLGGSDLPSADEIAYTTERIDPDGLRKCLYSVHSKLKRNKIIKPTNGWVLAAIDGIEIGSSYKRCCDECLQRKITVHHKKKVQYYHRLVALQIISEKFQFMFDVELVRPGEDEVGAALRLLERVLKDHPRCFDVLTADAIYLRPSVIDMLASHQKDLIAVLKENQPELLDEARRLLPMAPAKEFDIPSRPGRQARHIELREAEGFLTENIKTPLRIVHSHETGKKRERIAGKWVESDLDVEWYWATTLHESMFSSKMVFKFGHDRWKIENEGFNELTTRWHAKHSFHHHPNSILILFLILFTAHAVFHCFLTRNIKPELRRGHTSVYFSDLIGGSVPHKKWWPPPV